MAVDSIDGMSVSFLAEFSSLDSAEGSISALFAGIVESAAGASADITDALAGTAESFSTLSEAASVAGVDIGDGIMLSYESFDELAKVSEETASTVSESLDTVNFDGFQSALSTLTEAVDAATSQINEKLATIPAEAKDSADKSKSAFDGFSLTDMVQHIGLTIFGLQNMANTAKSVADGLLEPAMNAEKMQESFTNLTGSAIAASDELSKLDDFAAKTQFTTMDIDAAGAQLLGFGFKAQSIIPDITAVGDNLSAVGKGTPAEIQSVIDIFGKMSTQGKVTAMDINQLGAHGITAMADIEKGGGLTTKQLQKMLKDGTLPVNQAIADLTKGIEMNPIYSGGMAKQSGTLSGILSTLASDWDVFMATLMKPALPLLEQSLSGLTALLTNPSFKAFATIVGTDIMGALQGLGGSVGTVAGYFSNLKIDGLVASFKQLGTTLGPIVTDVLNAAGAFGTWMVKSGTLQGIIDGLTTGVNGLTTGIKLLWGGINNVIGVGTGLVNFFKNNQAASDALVAVLITLTGAMIGMAISAIPSLVLSLGATAAGFLGIVGPAIAAVIAMGPFILIGLLVAAVIFGIIEAVQHWGEIAHWLQGIWADVTNFFNDKVVLPFKVSFALLGDAFSGFGSIAHAVWNGIVAVFKGAINTIIGGIDNFIGFIDGIQIHIPSIGVGPVHTPSFDWNGLGIPKIPYLATGGQVGEGAFVAGEEGPELVMAGSGGATVYNRGQTAAMGAPQEIHVHIDLDSREMAHILVDPIGRKIVKKLLSQGPVRSAA